MKKITSFIFCLMLFLVSCDQDKTEDTTLPSVEVKQDFSVMLDNFYQGLLVLDPLRATQAGDQRYNSLLPNYLSKTYRDSSIVFYKKFKKQASSFKDPDLSESELMSKAIVIWECDIKLEESKYRTELFPIDQMFSLNLYMGQLGSGSGAQPFKTVEDYENWLKRLEAYVVWLNTAEQNMKEGVRIRYVLPSSLILKIIPQLKSQANENLEENLFYAPIKIFPKTFTKAQKDTLTASYTALMKDKLIPACKNLDNYVSSDYLNAGRTSSGIDAIPNGKKYYKFTIKKYTTTNMSADTIHNIGLREVARILSEMEKIKEAVAYKGDIISFFDFVRNNPKLMPFTKPEQVINNFNKIHHKMQPQLNKLFATKPKAKFEVRRTEAFREASASPQYKPGSFDGTRPGVFYVPIPDASKYNVYMDESVFLHEAIPGHHYQTSLTQENDSLPYFRKNLRYSAYGEGWALYTESLGKELGLYTDPYQYFGMLSAEMHRAIRLVVDTGIHTKGWTRERAIQYSLDNEAVPEARIVSEVERYMANPGQALSYKIGQMKILELRQMAETALGDSFDIKEFHDLILETGCIPLQLMEERVIRWVAMKNTIKETP